MQGRQHGCRTTAAHRKTQKVQMRMNDVELIGLCSERLLLHEDERCITIHKPRIQPEGMGTGGTEVRRGGRISTGKECNLVTLANEFFRNIGDDALCASIQSGRHAFPKRCDLCDLHGNYPFYCKFI